MRHNFDSSTLFVIKQREKKTFAKGNLKKKRFFPISKNSIRKFYQDYIAFLSLRVIKEI